MIRTLAIVAALAAALSPAQANVWDRAIEGKPQPDRDPFQQALNLGDEKLMLANSHGLARALIRHHLDEAIAAYRKAAALRPDAPEPHARIAHALHSFYIENCLEEPSLGIRPSPLRDCSRPTAPLDPAIVKQTIAAMDALEARAPLDPRFTVFSGTSLLFERAILHTKLATRPHLEAALRDYNKILDRVVSSETSDVSRVWGNLAETHMMLGDLNAAIDAYREAIRHSSDVSTWYGLAVALDREGSSSQAKAIIEAQGPHAYDWFREGVRRGNTFFVPEGEVYYYYALIEQALGQPADAIEHWNLYLQSGAHPQFHPRAKQHLKALTTARANSWRRLDPLKQ